MIRISQIPLSICLAVVIGAGTGCKDDGGTTPQTAVPKASFSSTEMVFNNVTDMVWIETDIAIHGYRERDRMLLGGYWYRKNSNGDYQYVVAACQTNVPNNYLGEQNIIDVPYDDTLYDQVKVAFVPFGCFANRTGSYFGRAKLYDTKSVGVDPNRATVAVSAWVSFSWSKASGHEGPPQPVARPVTAAELRELEALEARRTLP